MLRLCFLLSQRSSPTSLVFASSVSRNHQKIHLQPSIRKFAITASFSLPELLSCDPTTVSSFSWSRALLSRRERNHQKVEKSKQGPSEFHDTIDVIDDFENDTNKVGFYSDQPSHWWLIGPLTLYFKVAALVVKVAGQVSNGFFNIASMGPERCVNKRTKIADMLRLRRVNTDTGMIMVLHKDKACLETFGLVQYDDSLALTKKNI